LQTSPLADDVIGYSGATNTLLMLDAAGRIIGTRILHSADTPEHVAEVVSKRSFFTQFKTLKAGEAPDTVSGATLTSQAIASGILRRMGSASTSLRFPREITLDEVQSVMPAAARLDGKRIFDADGVLLGHAVRTSPVTDSLIGYKGPTDTLLVLDKDEKTVLHVRLRTSYDTEEYVGYVTGDKHFLSLFANMPVRDLAGLDFNKAGIEGVSGATETSYAVAEGLKRRAQGLMSGGRLCAGGGRTQGMWWCSWRRF
jgi:Na+-translocating ferredoxin:NAD+ oxidoreductase RnfG subunit